MVVNHQTWGDPFVKALNAATTSDAKLI
jgi:hypothetical protein